MQQSLIGENQISSPSTGVLIEVDHVSRVIASRAKKTKILDDVTFTVPEYSLFVINGPSGSGKSTLLNMLTGIDRPTTGRIVFSGQELRAMSENSLARWRGRHVGIIFQFFQLVPTLTVLENVLLALELGGGGGLKRRQWHEQAMACLEMALVKDLAARLPSELSGGEQQRVAIARALANNPPVIVADEPTGNLDSRTAHQVFETLAELTHQRKTVIYVTHDTGLATLASAGINLLDGRIVSKNNTQAIVTGLLSEGEPERRETNDSDGSGCQTEDNDANTSHITRSFKEEASSDPLSGVEKGATE